MRAFSRTSEPRKLLHPRNSGTNLAHPKRGARPWMCALDACYTLWPEADVQGRGAAIGNKRASLCAVRSAKQGLHPRHHLLVGNRPTSIRIGKSSQYTQMLLFIRWHGQARQQVGIGQFHIKASLNLTGHYSAQQEIQMRPSICKIDMAKDRYRPGADHRTPELS